MTTTHAPGRTGRVGVTRPSPAGRTAPPAPRQAAFWLLALVLGVTMLGTTLPTPLYVIYQGRWHFSAATVTVTFAVYAAAVLITLLLAGRSSDQAGRRPVMAVALAASALSTVLFILAPGIGVLIVARVVSGLSAGLMTGTATAALTELIPASASRRASLVATAANMGGLGLGPLIAGLFAQYAPHPTTLVFEVYLAVLAAAALPRPMPAALRVRPDAAGRGGRRILGLAASRWPGGRQRPGDAPRRAPAGRCGPGLGSGGVSRSGRRSARVTAAVRRVTHRGKV